MRPKQAGARDSIAALPMSRNRQPRETATLAAWAVVVAAVAVLGWIALARHPVGDYFTETDFYGYVWGARLVRRGTLDFARYSVVGPLYEIVLAALSFVARDLFAAAKLLSVAAAGGTLALWTALARRRAGGATALWTALVLAANPYFARYGYSATTDMLAVFLQSAAAFALFAGGRRTPLGRVPAPFAAGALVALAALTRYSALYLVPAAVLRYWLWPGDEERDAEGLAPGAVRARTWHALAGFAAGFGALVVPWLALSLVSGHAPGSNLVESFSFYLDPSARRNIQDLAPGAPATGYQSLADMLRGEPLALAGRLIANVPDHLVRNATSLLGPAVAAACCLGVVFAALDGGWRRLLPVFASGALLFGSLVPVFYSNRYALPLVPYYALLAGHALGSPLFALRVRPPGVPLKWIVGLLPLFLSLRASVAEQRFVASQLPTEVVSAGDALWRDAGAAEPPPARGGAGLDARLGALSRKMHLWYYSGLNPVAFPRVSSLAALADHCRSNGAHYIYFSWYEAELRPEFWYLLDTTAVVPGLERLPFAARNPTVLYRIGPGFGRDPDWLASDSLRKVHISRGQVRALDERHAWAAHYVLGVVALSGGDPNGALEHFLAATRGNPVLAVAWTGTGDALRALGREAEAAEAYERARRLGGR